MKFSSVLFYLVVVMNFSVQARKFNTKNRVIQRVSSRTIICGFVNDTIKKVSLGRRDFSIFYDERQLWNLPELIASAENGYFKFELQVDHPIYIEINRKPVANFVAFNSFSTRYASGQILIEPGDSIFIDFTRTASGLKFSSNFINEVFFSGKGVEKIWCVQDIIKNTRMFQSIEFLNISDSDRIERALQLSDSVINMVLKTIEIYRQKLTKTSITLIKAEYIPILVPDISETILPGLLTKSGMDISKSKVKKLYRDRIAQLNRLINPGDPTLSYVYVSYTNMLKRQAFLQYAMDNDFEYPETQSFKKVHYDALVKYLPNSVVKQRILARYLWHALVDYEGLSYEVELAIQDYISKSDTSNTFTHGLKREINLYKQNLTKGMNGFQFLLPDTLGNLVSMSQFKGKAVLIDFMFTNCFGCIELVPELTKVEKQFEGDTSIVFVSISIDKRFLWRLKGSLSSSIPESIFLYTDDLGIYHPVIKHYDVRAYPTLVLLDKEGKLVTARAPDPRKDSGEALIKLIKETIEPSGAGVRK